MVIRPAREYELEACARMQSASEPWKSLGVEVEQALAHLREPTREVWVLLFGSEVAGFCAFEMVGTLRGFVKNICVDSPHRGRGLGSKLLEAVEAHIFSSSPNIFLCVSSFNSEGRDFYRRHEYQQVGELRDFLIEGASEILLRKTRGPWLEREAE